MATNIISYISENIFIFLPLGITGVAVTIILYFTGKKEGYGFKDNLQDDYLKISKFNVNIYIFVYFFIWLMYLITGLLCEFTMPIIVSGILALIPIIIMFIISKRSIKNSKE